jgi:hypothetical protein
MRIRLDMRRYGCAARRRTYVKGEDRPLGHSEDSESAVGNCDRRIEEFGWKMLIRLPIDMALCPPEDRMTRHEPRKRSRNHHGKISSPWTNQAHEGPQIGISSLTDVMRALRSLPTVACSREQIDYVHND